MFELQKQFNDLHKNIMSERYVCEICKCEIQCKNKEKHEKTKKHLKMYINITTPTSTLV
jgi:hypothetical protein